MTSFRNRLGLLAGVALTIAGHAQVEEKQSAPVNLRGRLFCLAAYADRVDPGEPGDLVEAFFDDAGFKPPQWEGFGSVDFPIASESEEARKWFEQGVACLHMLLDGEAERAFRQVIALDPDQPMGFWGLAMANFDRPGRAVFFTRLAEGKLTLRTPVVERGCVESLSRLWGDAPERDAWAARLPAFCADLESLAIDRPEHAELKALLLRQLVVNEQRAGITVQSPWAVDRLAAEVLDGNPGHPCQHLRRFLWTQHRSDRLEALGLLAPESLPADAPPRAWRFLHDGQLASGRWQDGARSLVTALERDLERRHEWSLPARRDDDLVVNAVELSRTLSRMGRVEDSLSIARALMRRPLPGEVLDDESGAAFWGSAVGQGALAAIQVCHEHAIAEQLDEVRSALDGIITNLPSADRLQDELRSWTDPEVVASNEALSVEARAVWALKQDRPAVAAELLAGLPDGPRGAFLPKALWIIANHRLGSAKEALFAFDQDFRRKAGTADSSWREAEELERVAAQRRLAGDWILPPAPAADGLWEEVGKLAARLADPGPRIPSIALPNRSGESMSVGGESGRPTVLIFYLGAGCYQCMQQLHQFLPAAPKFQEAGLPLVAVCPDPVELLSYSLPEAQREGAPPPLELLSDPSMKAFSAVRAFNEVEGRPLHGTVLLDAEGRVRWRHVGNRPFMNPGWLLQEAQRLLHP